MQQPNTIAIILTLDGMVASRTPLRSQNDYAPWHLTRHIGKPGSAVTPGASTGGVCATLSTIDISEK
jgi:hypothetical protein